MTGQAGVVLGLALLLLLAAAAVPSFAAEVDAAESLVASLVESGVEVLELSDDETAAAETALNVTEAADSAEPDSPPPETRSAAAGAASAIAGAAATAARDLRQCRQVSQSRAGVVAAATWAVGRRLRYTQGSSRWSGINLHKCPTVAMPPAADCSSLVTWYFWAAYGKGRDFLNNQRWRAGYTGTMGASPSGRRMTISRAKPGDIILYGDRTKGDCPGGTGRYCHVALYVGGRKVVTFGSNLPGKNYGLPRKVAWNYRDRYDRSASKAIISFLP